MGGYFSRNMREQRETVDFVSLGMVVIDELRFPGKVPLQDVLGGSGAYGTLGARLFAKPEESDAVGCLVLAGSDFPQSAESTLRDWGTTLVLNKDPSRLSTRGLLEYADSTFGPKKFRYTTEPLRPSMTDLVASPLLASRCYHFLSAPDEVVRQVTDVIELRKRHRIDGRPLIVWEPSPASCNPENLKATLDACSLVDMISPNHLEVSRMFTGEGPKGFQPQTLESYAQIFLDHSVGHGGKGCVVIRAAEYGSLSASRAAGFIWSPAFYTTSLATSRVVDPTGAGNAFMGGFAVALQQQSGLAEAAAYGNVAASFALEQIGAPKREMVGRRELWNGVNVLERLEEYRNRAAYDIMKSKS